MYVKLFASILDSSVWDEPAETRLVWITMLCMADEDGYVRGTPLSVARRAVVSAEGAQRAIETLQSPDPQSNTGSHDGRRIEAVDGGWRIVNYKHYREMRTRDQLVSAQRQRMAGKTEDASGRYANGCYVYYAHYEGRVKIGMSRNPWARIKELRTAATSIALLAVEPGDAQTERDRHAQFEAYHLEREWFTYSDEIAAHVASIQRDKTTKTAVVDERSVGTTSERRSATPTSASAVPSEGTLISRETTARELESTGLADRFGVAEHRAAYLSYRASHRMPDGLDASIRAVNAPLTGGAGYAWDMIGAALLEMRGASVTFSPVALRAFCRRIQLGDAARTGAKGEATDDAIAEGVRQLNAMGVQRGK